MSDSFGTRKELTNEPIAVHAPQSTRPHGTYVKYTIEKCRCEPCRHANREYERQRNRRKAYGGEYWGWVDAEPVRAHVLSLMPGGRRYRGRRDGIGWKRIAKLAGVSNGTMSKLLYGGPGDRPPSRRVKIETARKLLSVTSDQLAANARVSREETRALWVLVDEIVAFYDSQNPRHYGGRCRLARELGNPAAKALQLSKTSLSVRHARGIREIHDRLHRESETFRWRYCKHEAARVA